MLEQSYSTSEVAALLGVTRPTVHRWVAQGQIAAFDIRGKGARRARLRFTALAVNAFIAANKVGA